MALADMKRPETGSEPKLRWPWWLLLNPCAGTRHGMTCAGPKVSSDGSKRLESGSAPRDGTWRIDEYVTLLYAYTAVMSYF